MAKNKTQTGPKAFTYSPSTPEIKTFLMKRIADTECAATVVIDQMVRAEMKKLRIDDGRSK